MKKWKGIVSLFLVFTLMLLSVPLPPVSAESGTMKVGDTGTTEDGFCYRLDPHESGYGYVLVITGYDPEKLKPDSVIPTSIKGRNVNRIADGAFRDCAILKSLSVQESERSYFQSIGEYAFAGCTNLERVSLENARLYTIGAHAFSDCTALKNVTFPWSIDRVEEYAFYNCTNLGVETGTIDLTEGSVGRYAFSGCSSLRYLDKITPRLGVGAFSGCTGLETVSINIGVTGNISRISNSLFDGCRNLRSVVIEGRIEEKKMNAIGSRAFAGCTNLQTLSLPKVTDNIEAEAFLDCISLTDLDFISQSDSVQIYERAFHGCDGLEEISLGETYWIRQDAFFDCNNLRKVEFSDADRRKIESGAFGGCENLQSVVIPDESGDVEIAPGAFEGSEKVVLSGYTNSAVNIFASQNGYAYSSLGEIPVEPAKPSREPESTELTYDGRTYNGSIMFDTDWYVMPDGPLPGYPTANLYDIGIVMAGNASEKELRVYSSRDGVAGVHKLPNGNYRVTGKSEGTSYIMLEVWDNGKMLNHYSVRISVQKGMWPYGQSARKRSYFN